MNAVRLTLRSPLTEPVSLEPVTPDRLATLTADEIARIALWSGRQQIELGQLFTVSGGPSSVVHIEGDLSAARDLAAGMAGGEMVIDGNVGNDVARAMSGGTVTVRGDAGDRLGTAAPGAARGMTGGEIIVRGSAGREVAARARRGLIVIGGDVGDDAARAIIAGTLVVFGRTGANPGRGSKRGSIVAAGAISVPATYREACVYRPSYVRLLMTYLRRRHDLTVDEQLVGGLYRRYCGDAGEPGKGEILEWTGA